MKDNQVQTGLTSVVQEKPNEKQAAIQAAKSGIWNSCQW